MSAAPLNVLVVGAGVCGPAFATLLQRSNPLHKITIIERNDALRASGQQVDLKTQAPHILRKMGLMEKIKAICVNETGFEMVNSVGRQVAYFPATAAGERRPGLTSEFELMRGDLVQVLYDASVEQNAELEMQRGTRGGIEYHFGRTITALDQIADRVNVTFSDGKTEGFDLVVAADGQGSRTRRLAFGEEVSNAAFKSWGIHAAYYSMPRVENEGTVARGNLAKGKRMIMTRPSGRPVTGALLFAMEKSGRLAACYRECPTAQKRAFADAFSDIEWQRDRLLGGMNASDEFYAHELGQIKMSQFSTGRVVLLGDAGYYPSPFTGLGTNLALMGSYILAGELTRHGSDIQGALKAYDEKMKPIVEECQAISIGLLGFLFPSSRFGVWFMERVMWVTSKANGLFSQFQGVDSHEQNIPDYPELNLKA